MHAQCVSSYALVLIHPLTGVHPYRSPFSHVCFASTISQPFISLFSPFSTPNEPNPFTGWQLVKLQGFGIQETVQYGLWRIRYTGTYTYTSDFIDWEPEVAEIDATAYPRVQATRACIVLALMALSLQFLVALRGYCARSYKVQRVCTISCAAYASADLAFTLSAILVWKSISEEAFHVVCSREGCSVSPLEADAFQMTPYYAWGFTIVKLILSFPGVVSLIYLGIVSSSSSSSQTATEMPVVTAVGGTAANAVASRNGGKRGGKLAEIEQAEDDAIIGQEEGSRGSPKTADSFGSTDSKKIGGKKGNGDVFDRNAHVSYILGGATGDPNPAWLNP